MFLDLLSSVITRGQAAFQTAARFGVTKTTDHFDKVTGKFIFHHVIRISPLPSEGSGMYSGTPVAVFHVLQMFV